MRYVMCKRPLSIADRFDSRQLITMVCRGYGNPHGDTHGYGYEDRYSVTTAALLITMASA